jgi:hypothetical protein
MKVAKWTPFVRYGLMILAGWLVRGGWMPEDVARDMAVDPLVLEAVSGAIVALGALAWYLYSAGRKAILAWLAS